MDCRNYKQLLDSYLCQELAVETNHQMLNHMEHCPTCRTEMASRKNMRESLRRACLTERMSDEACERLQSRLRAEASAQYSSLKIGSMNWRDQLAEFFSYRALIPVSVVILVLALGLSFFLKDQAKLSESFQAQLSESFIAEAADDHRHCATHYASSTEPAEMPDSVIEFDETCRELDKLASPGALGLTLRAAHVCQPDTRQFAHLVYTRGDNIISLLVAKRDGRALKDSKSLSLDPSLDGLQKTNHGELALGAYQTSKHIVMVVSDLPKLENEKLAQTLAQPVVDHIRRLDNQAANLLETDGRNLIGSLRRRELK